MVTGAIDVDTLDEQPDDSAPLLESQAHRRHCPSRRLLVAVPRPRQRWLGARFEPEHPSRYCAPASETTLERRAAHHGLTSAMAS